MRAVILDAATLGDDIDLSPIEQLVTDLRVYPSTRPQQLESHLANAQLVITNKVAIDKPAMVGRNAIFVLATGTNNIDKQAAQSFSIPVYNVENYGAAYVAQHT